MDVVDEYVHWDLAGERSVGALVIVVTGVERVITEQRPDAPGAPGAPGQRCSA